MLYRIAAHDAPMLIASLQELQSPSLTSNRTRKAIFNRLSQGIQKIMGLKGKVESLSIILTPSTVEIGVEMTKESFKQGETSGTLSVSNCNCGTIDGKPHEPDCIWWTLRGPKRVVSPQSLAPGSYKGHLEKVASGELIFVIDPD